MVDPVTAGLIGWACGKLGDSILKRLVSDRKLTKDVDKTVARWAKSLPKGRHVHPDALFRAVDPATAETQRPQYCGLQARLLKNKLPTKDMWHAVFMESWRWVRHNVEGPQDFFRLAESEASKELESLAEATHAVCARHEPIFRTAVIANLYEILSKLDEIASYLTPTLRAEIKAEALWPQVAVPYGGPKVSTPFAGRKEELEELGKAMGGDRSIVAVVGMAGQGKSCLAGEWYKRGARPPEGTGLFWRKVYEAGYSFDRFVDDLHLYLTGEHIDRQQITSVEKRAELVEGVLREKPCWIVLDGVERWLKRWSAEPHASVDDLTADDRVGQDPVFDKFLRGAGWWRDVGSQLLLTTRAVPSALDENPPLLIARKGQAEARLTDLKPKEAVALLKELGVRGKKEVMREAVEAYGCHPYAVHVLGVLIRDLYGAQASRWREVNPLEEPKLAGLFARIIEHRPEDMLLLALVACCVGPAPVEMLAEFLQKDELAVRKSLARLAKWQMVEFDQGADVNQHTVVRQFLKERMGREAVRELQKQIARWWAERDVPTNPTKLEQIQPLLTAVEHLVAAGEAEASTSILLSQWSAQSGYTGDDWMLRFGHLEEAARINAAVIKEYERLIENEAYHEMRKGLVSRYTARANALSLAGKINDAILDHSRAIEITERLIQKEERRELRNVLAKCYNNRGNAFRAQSKLSDAIADYGRAIEIYQGLVDKEARRELRNSLAACYTNRGNALADQGNLDGAIADYGRAIEIREQLVDKEGRRELRNDLANCYNNRGTAFEAQGALSDAIADHGRAIEIYQELVDREGRRELRNYLANCYNNRGNVLQLQGALSDAIAEYGRAIEIYQELVEKEGRRELRNDLAACYNNRGFALEAQGKPSDAITDYGRAIEIRQQLVDKEGRRELRGELGKDLFNRGFVGSERKECKEARADIDKGGELLREVIEEGQRHVLESFVQAAGLRCALAQQLGDPGKAAQWANDAIRWFMEEVQAERTNEVLLRAAALFAGDVAGNLKVLLPAGLDEKLWEKFLNALRQATSGSA